MVVTCMNCSKIVYKNGLCHYHYKLNNRVSKKDIYEKNMSSEAFYQLMVVLEDPTLLSLKEKVALVEMLIIDQVAIAFSEKPAVDYEALSDLLKAIERELKERVAPDVIASLTRLHELREIANLQVDKSNAEDKLRSLINQFKELAESEHRREQQSLTSLNAKQAALLTQLMLQAFKSAVSSLPQHERDEIIHRCKAEFDRFISIRDTELVTERAREDFIKTLPVGLSDRNEG